MSSKWFGIPCLVVGLVLFSGAMAWSGSGESATLSDLGEMDARLATLEKQVKIAELEAKLKDLKNPSKTNNQFVLPPAVRRASTAGMNQPVKAPQVLQAAKRPKVSTIFGTTNHLEAVLEWDDGTNSRVAAGSFIPNGGKVLSVEGQRVTVQYPNGQPESLAFLAPKQEQTSTKRGRGK